MTKTVMGQRLTKRDAIIASSPIKELKIAVGDVIDDGTNEELHLATGFPEDVANQMMANLESRFGKRQWRFWTI
jgi:hypothetical protein